MTSAQDDPRSTATRFVDARLPATVTVTGWLMAAAAGACTAAWWLDASSDGRRPAYEDLPRPIETLLLSGAAIVYVGFLWWAVAACVNGRRLRPLAGSPWLPVAVYIGGPALAACSGLIGRRFGDLQGDMVAGAAWLTCVVGHWGVIASLRSTARRVGAASRPFTQLLWVPILVSLLQGLVVGLLGSRLGEQTTVTLSLLVSPMLSLALAGIVWHASRTFDQACASDVTRRTRHDLPSGDVVAAALRRSVEV